MKKYLQFYQLSTGYIPGSIPPKFSDEFKRPIEKCGSDGIFPIDGRFNDATIHSLACKLTKERRSIGYKICFGLTGGGWLQESRLFLIKGN